MRTTPQIPVRIGLSFRSGDRPLLEVLVRRRTSMTRTVSQRTRLRATSVREALHLAEAGNACHADAGQEQRLDHDDTNEDRADAEGRPSAVPGAASVESVSTAVTM